MAVVLTLVIPISLLSGSYRSIVDWVLSAGIIVVFCERSRVTFAVVTVVLFWLAFPPASLPTYWLCFVPLIFAWRNVSTTTSSRRVVAEAIVIGMAVAWVSTSFVRDAIPHGSYLLHLLAVSVYGLSYVPIALAAYFTRRSRQFPAAIVIAVACVVGEFWTMLFGNGAVWTLTSISLAVVDSPVAQVSQTIGQVGVSAIVYLVNALIACGVANGKTATRRLVGALAGICVAVIGVMWGQGLERQLPASPLSFTALLVQPHLIATNSAPWLPVGELDRLTRESLKKNAEVDLIVWPEGCLRGNNESGSGATVATISVQSLSEFASKLQPEYRAACLVGAMVGKEQIIEQYGLSVVRGRLLNCGCLVASPDEVECHEKIALVPFKEWIPDWMDAAWVREFLRSQFEMTAPFSLGDEARQLSFRAHDGVRRTVIVAVCFESFLPWLPQFQNHDAADAVIHLIYDGDSAVATGFFERQIRACRFRAIQTRKWNLVCSTWKGSAVIDPSGDVIVQLPAVAGVLRTDGISVHWRRSCDESAAAASR